jgi:hypothetical protein
VIVQGVVVPDEIVDAILAHRTVKLCYKKDRWSSSARTINPYALYRSSANKVCLHGVQVAGPSSSDRAGGSGWRIFDISLISDVEFVSEEFEIRRDYKPHSPMYKNLIIDCLHGWS